MKKLALVVFIMFIGVFAVMADTSLTAGVGVDFNSTSVVNAVVAISPYDSTGMYSKVSVDLGFDLSRTSITVGPAIHKQFGVFGLMFGGGLNLTVLPQPQYNGLTFSGALENIFTRFGFAYDLAGNFKLGETLSIVVASEVKAVMGVDTFLDWSLSPYVGASFSF